MYLLHHKKILIATFVISALVSAGLSLLLPNYYKAQVMLLPSDTNSISKGILSQMDNVDPMNYGGAKDCEYILDIITSGRVVGAACVKFDLAKHYGIEAEGEELNEKLGRKLFNNIKAKRTENLAVKLTVWDTDPVYAANIANFMAREVSVVRNEIKKEKADSICATLERSRKEIMVKINVMSDSLAKISKEYGVYNPEGISERFATEWSKQVAAGNQAAVARLEAKMSEIGEKGERIDNIKTQLDNYMETLKHWNTQLEKAKLDRAAEIPTEFIVEYATPSFFKDKPKRSVIVLVSAISCTLLALFVLIIRDKLNGSKNGNEVAATA